MLGKNMLLGWVEFLCVNYFLWL